MSDLDLGRLRIGHRDCPSDYALDRLHAGESNAAETHALSEHVSTCEPCASRMRDRQAGFAGLGEPDPDQLWQNIRAARDQRSRVVSKVRKLPRGAAFGGLLAVAAALVLVWMPSQRQGEARQAQTGSVPAVPSAPVVTRMKGEFMLRVHRKRSAASEEASSGDSFDPGDILRFEVFLPGPGRVRVMGQEADGTLYTAWPRSATQRTWFASGGMKLLPGAVRLDAAPGPETLYALRCPEELTDPQCSAGPAGAKPRCPTQCDVASFVLNKTAR